MSADRDIERLLDAWLADGPVQVADHAFDEAVGRVYRERQRPAWRLQSWRFPTMSTPIKLVAIGAALLAVVLGGTVFLSGGGTAPGPSPVPSATPTPAPTASPTPTPSPATTSVGMVVQGKPIDWTVTIPPGWTGAPGWSMTKSQGYGPPTGIGVGAPGAVNVPSDPCDGVGKISNSRTPADVVAALESREDLVVSNVIDTMLGGYAGKRVDIQVPADLSACTDLYIIMAEPNGAGYSVQGPSQRVRMWILDVDGQPIVFQITSFAGTPASDMTEAQQIVDSIVITP
jgi:hypothetical protein